jgi:hypothetical protein
MKAIVSFSDITGNLTAVLERIYEELHGSRDANAEPMKHHRKK